MDSGATKSTKVGKVINELVAAGGDADSIINMARVHKKRSSPDTQPGTQPLPDSAQSHPSSTTKHLDGQCDSAVPVKTVNQAMPAITVVESTDIELEDGNGVENCEVSISGRKWLI